MISKQNSLINVDRHQQMVNKSASSATSLANKSNRKFLAFCAFLLTLLLGSSLQRASSYLPTYNRLVSQKAFTRKRFNFSTGVVLRATGSVQDVKRDDAFYCDRSHHRTDVCVAKGDVRVKGDGGHAGGRYEVLLLSDQAGQERVEIVKPYTRKGENRVMKTIDEVTVIKKMLLSRRSNISRLYRDDQDISAALHLPADGHFKEKLQQKREAAERIDQFFKHKKTPLAMELQQKDRSFGRTDKSIIHSSAPQARPDKKVVAPQQKRSHAVVPPDQSPACEVQHAVAAIVFSTGGYTGNVYHEFNDGLIPLFITAQRYPPGQVVLVVLAYHERWMRKYAEVVAQITNYTVIDLAREKRVHCFPEVTVGLRIHDELSIHDDHTETHHLRASMQRFQSMLRAAYLPRLHMKSMTAAIGQPVSPSNPLPAISKQPKLVIISRRSPRALLNQQQVVSLAEEIGFSVQVLSPTSSTKMVKIYWALNNCDVMMGVHGAAMTHLLFMRPGATLIQVVPLGTDWAAATYYGEPAEKLGLNYVEYKVNPTESSLLGKYARDDPVLVNPESVNRKTKRIYLEGQDVTISLPRMSVVLRSVHARAAITPL